MNENHFIQVRVKTNANKEVLHKKGEKFFIEVKEKAQRGEANTRVKELIARELGCTSKALRLIKGGATPSKTYLFTS